MVYLDDFEVFYDQAVELFKARPLETRYSVKYRNCDGKLVLKVTDDVQCLKYKTDQQADLKKLERLTTTFFALTARGDLPPEGLEVAQQVTAGQQPAAASKKPRRKG